LDRGPVPAIRSLPRCFIDGIELGAESVILPPDEQKKIRQVLRLNAGDWIAVLPGNGEIWACQLDPGASATVCERHLLPNPAKRRITLAQGLPRPEKLEEVIRMGTEVGVDSFLIFPSDRSIVKWDERKVQERLKRLRTIAREASEVCLRPYVPTVEFVKSLGEILSLCDRFERNRRSSCHLISKAHQTGGTRGNTRDRTGGRLVASRGCPNRNKSRNDGEVNLPSRYSCNMCLRCRSVIQRLAHVVNNWLLDIVKQHQ
jgi:RsmE family RNA methyltransferase